MHFICIFLTINLTRIPHSVLIQSLSKLGIEWNSMYLKKNIYKTPTAGGSILNGEVWNAFSLSLGTRQGCLHSSPTQHHTGGPSQCNKTRKSNKRHPDWGGRSKTIIHRCQVHLRRKYGGNSKKSLSSSYQNKEVHSTRSQDARSIYKVQLYFYLWAMKSQNNANCHSTKNMK